MQDAHEPVKNEPSTTLPATTQAAGVTRGECGRAVFGGALMGLANLVPGISGGTMLLAAGVYRTFIESIADVSTLRFRRRSLIMLALIAGAAFIAIIGLAKPLHDLVVERRWIMYSLFIGLTLGGVPLLYRMAKPLDRRVVIPAVVGLAVMIGLAVLQSRGASQDAAATGAIAAESSAIAASVKHGAAGVAGAAAMVLPGVSGSYLLLIMGEYLTILQAVGDLKDGLTGRDGDLIRSSLGVVIPVGIGVVVGIVVVSTMLRWLLRRAERATLGFLLGLLIGAVAGLWPFRAPEMPAAGTMIKGRIVELRDGSPVAAGTDELIEVDDWPNVAFTPDVTRIVGSIALIGIGFLVSIGVTRIGASGTQAAGRKDR